MIYVPNVGELEALQNILVSQAFELGIYKAHVTPDGNTIFSTMEELDAEAGGYATKSLSNDICLDALTADKWFITVNAEGKAEATYDAVDTPQEWLFNADDIANADTAYGIFMWTLTLDFTSGSTEFKVGDHAYGSVKLVNNGTGKADIQIKTSNGNTENINNVAADDVTDLATVAGDSDKKLFLVEAFSSGQAVDTVGQIIQYTPKITLSTA